MLKSLAIACAAIGLMVIISGFMFISQYSISGSSTSVIEATLMEVSHLRYIAGLIFGMAAAILFSAHQVIRAIQEKQGQDI